MARVCFSRQLGGLSISEQRLVCGPPDHQKPLFFERSFLPVPNRLQKFWPFAPVKRWESPNPGFIFFLEGGYLVRWPNSPQSFGQITPWTTWNEGGVSSPWLRPRPRGLESPTSTSGPCLTHGGRGCVPQRQPPPAVQRPPHFWMGGGALPPMPVTVSVDGSLALTPHRPRALPSSRALPPRNVPGNVCRLGHMGMGPGWKPRSAGRAPSSSPGVQTPKKIAIPKQ